MCRGLSNPSDCHQPLYYFLERCYRCYPEMRVLTSKWRQLGAYRPALAATGPQ